MPDNFEIKMLFLHPSQRKLVEKNFNGPARVTGGAGTGKTVVAMHRAKEIVRKLDILRFLYLLVILINNLRIN